MLHCTALHCTTLHCTVLQCTAVHCSALHCTALHCFALPCTRLHSTALDSMALHCSSFHCKVDLVSYKWTTLIAILQAGLQERTAALLYSTQLLQCNAAMHYVSHRRQSWPEREPSCKELISWPYVMYSTKLKCLTRKIVRM